MRKRTTYVMAIFSLWLLLVPSGMFLGQESAPRWFDPIIHSLKSIRYLGVSPTKRFAVERMHNHADELRRLEAQRLSKAQIRARFQSRATKSAPMRIASASNSAALESAAPSGAISGALFEVGGGHIQQYASVTVYDEFGNYAGYTSTNASKKGKYRISGLDRGKYYVRAGSYYYGYKYFRDTTDWRKAKLVRVKNRNRKGINFRFVLKRGSGAISGFVRRTSGEPIPEAEITAYNDDFDWAGSANSDGIGRYTIQNLPSGEYFLRVFYRVSGESGYSWYKNTSNYENADPVQVNEPETTSGINFVIPFGGTISGKIISSSGKAVEAYSCYVNVYDIHQNTIRSTAVGEKGKFTLAELCPGKYKLYIDYRGQDNNQSSWYLNAPSFKKAKAIRIASKQKKNFRIKLKPGATISGLVTNYDGQPPPRGCDVVVYDLKGYRIMYRGVNSDGTYALACLPSGSYKVFIDTSYSYSYSGTSPCSEWYGESRSFEEAQGVHVHAPHTTGNINIHLDRGGYIAGRVVSEWQTYPGYSGDVNVYDLKGNFVRHGDIWYDNSYIVDGLPSGNYKLLAYTWGDEYSMFKWYKDKQNFETAASVSITSPGGVGGVDFTLEPRAYVYGLLEDFKGIRLSSDNLDLQVYAFDAESGEYITYGPNSFTGGYRLGLLRGSYKFASMSYCRDIQTRERTLARAFYPRGTEFYSPDNHIIWTAPLETKRLNKLVLNKAAGSISGRIFDQSTSDSLEVNAYVVMAFDQNGFLAAISGCSICDGPVSSDFGLTGLRPGSYYVAVMTIYDCSYNCQIYTAWYNGVILSEEEAMMLSPKADIPSRASVVIVGEGDTSGVDFYVVK